MSIQNKSKDRNSKPHKQQRKSPRKITETYLHNAGLYYLERFSSSTENFRRVMRRKILKSCIAHKDQNIETCHEQLEKIICKFERLELLDDNKYTRMMVQTLHHKGKSTRYITSHLSSKGIAKSLIKQTLEKLDTKNNADYTAALIHARKKKLGPFRRPDKEANIQKEMGSLARAGFSYDISKKIVNMTNEESIENYDASSEFISSFE